MVSLDESSFPALELNNRRLSVKNSFCRKNGIYTRYRPPATAPSPGQGEFFGGCAHPSVVPIPLLCTRCGVGMGLVRGWHWGGDPVLPSAPPPVSCSRRTSPDVPGCQTAGDP